jgi:hypothetical protein
MVDICRSSEGGTEPLSASDGCFKRASSEKAARLATASSQVVGLALTKIGREPVAVCSTAVCPQKFHVCSKESRTGSYEDKKPPPLNNNEDKKLSLLRGGRERESGPGLSLSFWVELLT